MLIFKEIFSMLVMLLKYLHTWKGFTLHTDRPPTDKTEESGYQDTGFHFTNPCSLAVKHLSQTCTQSLVTWQIVWSQLAHGDKEKQLRMCSVYISSYISRQQNSADTNSRSWGHNAFAVELNTSVAKPRQHNNMSFWTQCMIKIETSDRYFSSRL